MRRQVLISGATGYLGPKVAGALEAMGANVMALLRNGSKQLPDSLTCATHVWNGSELPQADVLLLLGTVFSGETRAGEESVMTLANVDWPVTLTAQFLREQPGGHVVAVGTCWEATTPDGAPVNTYAATKVACRYLLETICRERSAALCWLALSDTYGIDDHRPKVFGSIRAAVRGGRMLAMSAGEQDFDPLPADEAARALALACMNEPQAVSGRWSIAGQQPMSLKAKVEQYCRVIGVQCPAVWGARPYRFGEPFRLRWAEAPPWWRPRMTFEQGVVEMEQSLGGLLHERTDV